MNALRTELSPRPRLLFERRTDALIEMRAEEYLNRHVATEYVRTHDPYYADPDDFLTFESYLEWAKDYIETDRRPPP